MATKDKTAPAGDKPKVIRPSAVLALDVSSAVDGASLDTAVNRRTQWDSVLDELYSLTEKDEVPTNEDGSLRFVRIGHYTNSQGAKAQVKSFIKRGIDKTFEFRVSGTDLFARVVKTDD